MEADVLTDLTTGKKYPLKPLGDVSRRGGWGVRQGTSSAPGFRDYCCCRCGGTSGVQECRPLSDAPAGSFSILKPALSPTLLPACRRAR